MSLLKAETNKVLYPEPPLGNEELEVLKNIAAKMGRSINFCTPMSHFTEGMNLEEKQIGISISDSSDISQFGIGVEMFQDLTIELARHILKANGRLIYGGDLRKNGFTELLRDLARQYGQKEKAEAEVHYVKNYLAWPIFNDLSKEKRADYLASRIELVEAKPGSAVKPDERNVYIPKEVSFEAQLKWATSLTQMRIDSIEQSAARIISGGKVQGFTGFMPGIAEEFMFAYNAKKPIFLIGGFGGCAHVIADILEGKANSQLLKDICLQDINYKKFIDWTDTIGFRVDYSFFDNIRIDELNNGLNPDDNIRLLHSVDIIEIVSLVLKGLSNSLNHA